MKLESTKILEIFNNHNHTQKKSEKLLFQKINEFKSKTLQFDWLHAGTSSLTINELSGIISHLPTLPTRTGHLGNWQEIAEGRGSALEHNGIVCGAKKLAYPLIIDLNQIENESMDSGDIVYLPGSIINKGKRNKLSIRTWNGESFEKRDRTLSYFSPFTLAEIDGQLTPITVIHRKNILTYPHAKFVSSLFIQHKAFITDILRAILTSVVFKNSKLQLHDIIDRTVSLDGSLIRTEIKAFNGGFQVGGIFYANVDQLIEAIFLPLQAAHDPTIFFDNIKNIPDKMPFLSLSMLSTLPCLLNAHHINSVFPSYYENEPFLPYFEWGAFDSAGYPPRSKGYFREKVTFIREFYRIIIQTFPNITPAFFILLPSTIFNLLPCDAYHNDIEIVNELIETILHHTETIKSSAVDILLNKVEFLTYEWFFKYKDALSPYYIKKFGKQRCIYQPTDFPERSNPVDLASFNKLSLQKSCMLMGAMREIISTF